MPPVTYKQLEDIRDKALEVLGPFGFVADEGMTHPATLRHPELRESYDVSATDPYKIVLLVARKAAERGFNEAQQRMRLAIGLS